MKFPIKVNCWFCNSNTKVPYVNHNSWYCPHCEQYNGFAKDGGYNRQLLEQYNPEFNHPTWNTKVKRAVKQLNGLCRVCNINQELKVAQLAQFIPFDPSNFDYEVEQYSNKLEKAYRLCPQCDVKLKETLEKQRYLFKGLNIKMAQKIVSTAIKIVQQGNKFYTISTAIISGCLLLSGLNYFISNSWLKVYLKQTIEDILLVITVPEFILHSAHSGTIGTVVDWISAQTDWINSKVDDGPEVSFSSLLTGVGTLLQCQRNVSTALNVISWSILFGLSLSPAQNQTAVLIKAVEMSAAFVFFVLNAVSLEKKQKPIVVLKKYNMKARQMKASRSFAAAEPETKTETTPKKSKIPDLFSSKSSSPVSANRMFSSLGKTCSPPHPPQGRSPLHPSFEIEEEDFGFSRLNIGTKKEKYGNLSSPWPGFETKLYGAQIPMDLFRSKSPVLTPPKLNTTEKCFNLSSAFGGNSNAPLTRSSSQSSGFGSLNQPILESSRASSPYQQSLYLYPFPSFHPSLPYIHLAAQYHQLCSAAAILDRSNDSSFNSRFSSNTNNSCQNIKNTLYSPLIILLIFSNVLLLTFVMYKEFIVSKV